MRGAIITTRRVKKFEIPMLVATNSVGKKFGWDMNKSKKFAMMPARLTLIYIIMVNPAESSSAPIAEKKKQAPAIAEIAENVKKRSLGLSIC